MATWLTAYNGSKFAVDPRLPIHLQLPRPPGHQSTYAPILSGDSCLILLLTMSGIFVSAILSADLLWQVTLQARQAETHNGGTPTTGRPCARAPSASAPSCVAITRSACVISFQRRAVAR